MRDGWRQCLAVLRVAAQLLTPLQRFYPHLEEGHSQVVRQCRRSQL